MSGLFEAPFLYQPESIPLRRRENDAFVSPSRRRRRRYPEDDHHWCIRSAMKAILISPLIVLLIWSIAAVAFTHRMRGGVARGATMMKKKNVIVQPQLFHRNAAQPIVTQGQYYSFPTEEQLSGQQAPLQRQANEVPLPLPLVYPQQPNIPPMQANTGGSTAAQFQAVIGHPAEGNPAVARPLQGMQSPNMVLPTAQQVSDETLNAIMIPKTTESVAAAPLVPAPPVTRKEPSHGNLRNGVRYFYYDPHATARDAQGNVYLPEFVYDANGQAIHLQSLAKSKSVYISPPRTMIHHNISMSNSTIASNSTHPNTIHTPAHRQAPAKGIPLSDWGTSHRSDSSVIVGTVGVMALLVGALSARKLRSRNLLSACIENETLEDEAAYDAAHTHHYNTFQQGWKGDLEKFDV